MQDTFLFQEMQETHGQQKTKIDIDKFITGTTNMTLLPLPWVLMVVHALSSTQAILPTW